MNGNQFLEAKASAHLYVAAKAILRAKHTNRIDKANARQWLWVYGRRYA